MHVVSAICPANLILESEKSLPVNQRQRRIKRFLAVDSTDKFLNFFKASSKASSIRKIYGFVKVHLKELTTIQLEVLQQIKLENKVVEWLKNRKMPKALKMVLIKVIRCFASVLGFMTNIGKFDQALLEEVRQLAHDCAIAVEKQKMTSLFFSNLKENRLGEKIIRLTELKKTLVSLQKRREENALKMPEEKDVNEKIEGLKERIAGIERRLRRRIYCKQMRKALKALVVEGHPSRSFIQAMDLFLQEYQVVIGILRFLSGVRFSPSTKLCLLDVRSNAKQYFELKTNFTPRVDESTVILTRGYSLRPENSPSVRRFINEYFTMNALPKPEDRALLGSVSMELLKEMEEVDFLQMTHAAFIKFGQNNFHDEETSIDVIRIGANLFAHAFNTVLQTFERKESLACFIQAIKKEMSQQNCKEEMITKEIYANMIGKRKIFYDLMNAPELRELHQAFISDNWRDDELKKVTLTCLKEQDFKKIERVISLFFEDGSVRAVLAKF